VSLSRYGVIVAARTGSRRLPGKALLPLADQPSIAFLLNRLKASREAAYIVLATTTLAQDDALAACAADCGIPVFRGAGEDVVARFVDCTTAHPCDYALRVTGDCPFLDAESLDFFIQACRGEESYDLASTKTLWPVGIDYEAYPAARMAELNATTDLRADDREHLTKYLYDRPEQFRICRIAPPAGYSRAVPPLTLDTPDDYVFMTQLAQTMGPWASTHSVIAHLQAAGMPNAAGGHS